MCCKYTVYSGMQEWVIECVLFLCACAFVKQNCGGHGQPDLLHTQNVAGSSTFLD